MAKEPRKAKSAKAKSERAPGEWSDTAKVGAAVGSAALVAALLYAGSRRGKGRKKGEVPPAPTTVEPTD